MNKICCPHCQKHFDVENALSQQLESKIRQQYEQQQVQQQQQLSQQQLALEQQQRDFEQKKARENEIFKQKLDAQTAQIAEKHKQELAAQSAQITQQQEQKAAEQFAQQLAILKQENEAKQAENRELKQKELFFMQKEQALKEKEEELQLQVRRDMLEQTKIIEEKARAKERAANELKEREYKKQLEDQQKLVDEMKRKAEQGSMQLQGEVQELAIEELLQAAYPFDTIEEVAKGVRGADCLQTVINNVQKECGSIVYESKRTKNWSNDWLEKLKKDQAKCKADIAVLVTATMPRELENFGMLDGVWVCRFEEVKSLSMALRQQILSIQSVKSAEENKGDKMELMYKYLTSSEFAQNIQHIVDHYDVMTLQLARERRAMEKNWKEREKQIISMQENMAALFGSVQGIAGNQIKGIAAFELDGEIE